MSNIDKIQTELDEAGYGYGLAIATDAEVEAGAACGQMAILDEAEEQSK